MSRQIRQTSSIAHHVERDAVFQKSEVKRSGVAATTSRTGRAPEPLLVVNAEDAMEDAFRPSSAYFSSSTRGCTSVTVCSLRPHPCQCRVYLARGSLESHCHNAPLKGDAICKLVPALKPSTHLFERPKDLRLCSLYTVQQDYSTPAIVFSKIALRIYNLALFHYP